MLKVMIASAVEIVAEGHGSFDGHRVWEERCTLDCGHVDDAEDLTRMYAESLRVRYQCCLT